VNRPYVKILTSEDGKSYCTEYGTDISEEDYKQYLIELEEDYIQCEECGEYNDPDAIECWDCGSAIEQDIPCDACCKCGRCEPISDD